MSLTKSDLSSIRQVVREETKPQFQKLEKKIDKVDRKFDKLFNFLDKDHTKLVKRVRTIENNLEISPPEF